MMLVCSAVSKCDNPECMHCKLHEPVAGYGNKTCHTHIDICPLWGRVRCQIIRKEDSPCYLIPKGTG